MAVVETLEGLERQVNLSLSINDVEQKVKSELQRQARKAKVQGFRPGKAPLSVVERMYGPGIRYDVINQQVGEALDKALSETQVRLAGAPSVEPAEGAEEGQLAFKAIFEVYPDVTVPEVSALEVTRFNTEVSEDEVNRTLDILRKQRATYEAREGRAAQKDDRINVDFVGKIDGVEFEGGKAEGYMFILGMGHMLPEFEAAVEGLKVGESKTFDLNFPEGYGGPELSGKTAEFTIKVNEVAEAILPALDNDFAKSLGQEDGNIDKLLEEVRSNIAREVKNRSLARTKNSVMDSLAKSSDFLVPKTLVNNDVESRIAQMREDLKARGVPDADKIDLSKDTLIADSERRVRLGLLVAELVEVAKLQPTPDQIRARIEEFSQNYEQPQEVIAYYLSDRQRRAEIEAIVLEDNVVDHILANAKVTDENIAFDTLMGTM